MSFLRELLTPKRVVVVLLAALFLIFSPGSWAQSFCPSSLP